MSEVHTHTSHKKVAVITRTLNRPIMLERACEDVMSQTSRDFTWVIINDGGDQGAVEKTVEKARSAGVSVISLHNAESKGMEAASNRAIKASESDYVVIHDDDDTWHPDFLRETCAVLDSRNEVAGVVVHSTRVLEQITENGVKVLGSEPFNYWLSGIYLSDMARENTFPPISFLFRRAVFETLGYFNEALPVLGDWDFNLRFLERYDAAVLPRPLANYHHRIGNMSNGYGNSVFAANNKHKFYDSKIRNAMLRNDLHEGRFGMGVLVSLSRRDATPMERVSAKAESLGYRVSAILKRTGLRALLAGVSRRLASAPKLPR